MQEQEQRQRELREKLLQEQRQRERLAQIKIENVRGLGKPDAIFGPVPDFIETRRPITRFFFAVYDNLGVLMAVNIFTFLLTLPLIYVLLLINAASGSHKSAVALLPLLLVGLVAPPGWAAASSFCAKIVEEQVHPLGEYWSDYRRYLLRGIVLAVGQWLVGGILVYSTGWYLTQPGALFKVVGIASLYALVFWALIGLYLWPLMVRGYRWRSILRNAAVLTIASPLRSVIILVVLVVLTIILSVTVIGLATLVFALWAMLPNQALVLTRERLERRGAGRAT